MENGIALTLMQKKELSSPGRAAETLGKQNELLAQDCRRFGASPSAPMVGPGAF